jgi:membrane associated rhomboid family serine protease
MTSGADLFVVCKQCGSEVSPYITECPYCGHRLRRRAPKLPRAHVPSRTPRPRGRLRGLIAATPLGRAGRVRERPTRFRESRWIAIRPYATILLVAVGAGAWVAARAEPRVLYESIVLGPLHGQWWRLFTSSLVYGSGIYAFVCLTAIALFGWLLEQRHGPVAVLVLFFGAAATGALVALAAYPVPVVSGGQAAALALLAAWAVPDLESAREGSYYDGDLLGAAAFAALLLAMPFAVGQTSWLAGLTGGAVGLLFGVALHRMQQTQP